MAIHAELTGAGAVHPAAFVAAADPGAVGADKFWVDTSHEPPWLWVRDAGNTAWLPVADVHGSDLTDVVNDLQAQIDAHTADESAHGQLELAQRLLAWCASEAFEMLAITYHVSYPMVIEWATVRWPDGSDGRFDTREVDTTWKAINAYTVTHDNSSLTVTQAAVTRDANGLITAKPALTVA